MPFDKDYDRLIAIAEVAETRPAWRGYAKYCGLRGQGLRPAAMAALDAFINDSDNWPFEARLEFIQWVLTEGRAFGDNAALIPQPLHARLAVPTVVEWSARSPNDARAHLWLGLLGLDAPLDHLKRALELDPTCEMARKTLFEWSLDDVDYNQHHMPDFYIHDPRPDLVDLDLIEGIVRGSTAISWVDERMAEINALRTIALEWLAAHPTDGDFATS